MKIIVTGGLGFIGINLITKLLKNKNNLVMNIDKESTYSSKNKELIFKKNKKYKFIKIDISNINRLRINIKKFNPDIIFHLAAESHVDRSISNPDDFIYSNIVGTYNLLKISSNQSQLMGDVKALQLSLKVQS